MKRYKLSMVIFIALISFSMPSSVLVGHGMENPCAVNPCAVNPCAVNPCAVNPCASLKLGN